MWYAFLLATGNFGQRFYETNERCGGDASAEPNLRFGHEHDNVGQGEQQV